MKSKISGIVQISLVSVSLFFSFMAFNAKKKIGYFDYNEVYNNCSLKKKLEKDLIKVAGLRKNELDSMQLELTLISNRIKENQAGPMDKSNFEILKQRFMTYQQKYEQENISLKETYFSQIRQEINESVKTYAEQHNYDYLFAIIGDGSLMYGSDKEDVTKDFQKFIDK